MAIYPEQPLIQISHQATRFWTRFNPSNTTLFCNLFIELNQLWENPTCEGRLICPGGHVSSIKKYDPIFLVHRIPQQGISVCVLLPITMDDVEAKLENEFQPPGELPLWFLEVQLPGQRTMINADGKLTSQRMVPELAQTDHDGQQLPTGDTISPLLLVQFLGSVSDNFLVAPCTCWSTPPIPKFEVWASRTNSPFLRGNATASLPLPSRN